MYAYALNLTGTDYYFRGGYARGWFGKHNDGSPLVPELYDREDHVIRVYQQVIARLKKLEAGDASFRSWWGKALQEMGAILPVTEDTVRIIKLEMSMVDVLPTPVKKTKKKEKP